MILQNICNFTTKIAMKHILIDTQILIWISEKDPKIKKLWLDEIADMNNKIYISIVSFWEISIKMCINKLQTKANLQQLFDFVNLAEIEVLPILPKQILLIKNLPFHHKDPFDRLIISQAIYHNYLVISSDSMFNDYNITLLN